MSERGSTVNTDNLVVRGFKPWLPSPHARNLEVWHEYELPTAGTFDCDEGRVLFTHLGDIDPEQHTSTWGYTVVPAHVTEHVAFKSSAEMDEWIERAFHGACVVYAMASDLMIQRWSPVERVPSLYEGAVGFMDSIVKELRGAEDDDPELAFEARKAEATVLVQHAELV